MEPVAKFAGTQAIPEIYRGLHSVAVTNLTNHPVTWRAGLHMGNAVQMDASQDISERRAEALRAVRYARGESIHDPSLEQLCQTLGLRENLLLRGNPYMLAEVYAIVRKYRSLFTSFECQPEEMSLGEYPVSISRPQLTRATVSPEEILPAAPSSLGGRNHYLNFPNEGKRDWSPEK